jgi:hypothetical protein
MSLRLNDAFRNDLADRLAVIFASGSIEVRTGAQPADPDDAASGTLLATISLPATPFGAAASGAVAKSGTWSGVAVADGTAGWARFKNAAGTRTFDCSVAESAADLIIDDDAIVTGGQVTVTSFTYTIPAA